MCNFFHGLLVVLCMYVFLSVCVSVPSFLRQILMFGADIVNACQGSVGALKQILNSPGRGIVEEQMWLFDINYVMETQMERET